MPSAMHHPQFGEHTQRSLGPGTPSHRNKTRFGRQLRIQNSDDRHRRIRAYGKQGNGPSRQLRADAGSRALVIWRPPCRYGAHRSEQLSYRAAGRRRAPRLAWLRGHEARAQDPQPRDAPVADVVIRLLVDLERPALVADAEAVTRPEATLGDVAGLDVEHGLDVVALIEPAPEDVLDHCRRALLLPQLFGCQGAKLHAVREHAADGLEVLRAQCAREPFTDELAVRHRLPLCTDRAQGSRPHRRVLWAGLPRVVLAG